MQALRQPGRHRPLPKTMGWQARGRGATTCITTMPKRRSVHGTCWAIGSVPCCLQPMNMRQTSRCCLSSVRGDRDADTLIGLITQSSPDSSSATTHVVTLQFTMSKGDRLTLAENNFPSNLDNRFKNLSVEHGNPFHFR